jgi:hypothetical protein
MVGQAVMYPVLEMNTRSGAVWSIAVRPLLGLPKKEAALLLWVARTTARHMGLDRREGGSWTGPCGCS